MNKKKLAGERAVDWIQDNMIIGLGTGSTVYWTIKALAIRRRQGLRVQAVPTSRETERIAKQEGIPLTTFEAISHLDLTIDGADEISPSFDLIKGAGGALLREKLVAKVSKTLLIVADESKHVSSLGGVPLPVEVVPFAWQTTRERLMRFNCLPILRLRERGQPFVTDNGNYILDCSFDKIEQADQLEKALKGLTGVVETGLFTGLTKTVILGYEDRVEVLTRG